jgi:large subunit ribosomal protein L54
MICRQCIQRLTRRTPPPPPPPHSHSQRSAFSSTALTRALAVSAQDTTASHGRPHDKPAATSTSAAQPFSTPLTPSPSAGAGAEKKKTNPKATGKSSRTSKIVSIVAAGTVLKGLNFMKNLQDPVAMEDHEYPEWLWAALESSRERKKTAGGVDDGEGDLFCRCFLFFLLLLCFCFSFVLSFFRA